MDYLITFLVGLLIGAGVSYFVVRNNPKFLSVSAKKQIEDAIGKATGLINWNSLKR